MAEAADGGETPQSPTFPPLASASLFPPPPPTYSHFTAVNVWLHQILTQHEEGGVNVEGSQGSASASTSTQPPRLIQQQRVLLLHAPAALTSAPEAVQHECPDEEALRSHISSLSVDLRLEMDPPDLSVIKGVTKGYHLFGQWWPIPPIMTGIEEAGIKRLYSDADGSGEAESPGAAAEGKEGAIDRRPSLQLLLRSFLTSYLKLLSLLQFPPSYYALRTFHETQVNQPAPSDQQQQQPDPQGDHHTDEWLTTASDEYRHLRTLTLNFQEVLNRSRAEQSRMNLKALMRKQIEDRQEETRKVNEKIREIEDLLGRLKRPQTGEDAVTLSSDVDG